MDEQKKQTSKAAQRLTTPAQIYQDIDFDLADFPEPKTVETLKPELRGGELRRAKQLASALLNNADTNNDGKLDREELRRISNYPEEARSIIKAATEALETAHMQAGAKNKELREVPANGRILLPYVTVAMPTSASIDDVTLIDHTVVRDSMVQQLNIPSKTIDSIIRKVLPKGIEEVKLSDECRKENSSICTPSVPGKVHISIVTPDRS